MNRRSFLQMTAASCAATMIPAAGAKGLNVSVNSTELARHKLVAVKYTPVQLRYPRPVGKNSRIGLHGTGPRITMCTITTDQGAEGLGLLRGSTENADKVFDTMKNKPLSELFSIAQGTLNDAHLPFDFVLYDLAGVIMNKPVYALMGAEKPILARAYSGMIYFDEMEPENNPAGFGKVLENCQFDINYGYRLLKVKIGRGGRWMPRAEGLKADIEITRLIHEHFPQIDILVDANDAYTVDECIAYLKGIENVPLFWIEEPFRETHEDCTKLKKWLLANSRRNTLLADGEADPDLPLALELGKEQIMDVYLDDISGYSLTRWRKLAPRLKEIGMMQSPHTWGDTIKAYYNTHFVAAYGNAPTLEGVTCFSGDIDFTSYRIVNGCIVPPSAPGFGMRLLT